MKYICSSKSHRDEQWVKASFNRVLLGEVSRCKAIQECAIEDEVRFRWLSGAIVLLSKSYAEQMPFALCEPSDTDPTTGLLVSVHNQLMLMYEDRILDIKRPAKIIASQKTLYPVRALLQLKSFCASDLRNVKSRSKKLFRLEIKRDQIHAKIIASLKTLDPVRALLELKSFGASDLRNVKFRSKKLLQQLQRTSSDTDSEELWLTRGQCVSGEMDKNVYPELVLMSRDESMVVIEMGMPVQEHQRFSGYLEKILHIPPPSIGLPEPAKLFSSAKFVVPKAANAAKSLNDIKCKLDGKDLAVWGHHTKKTLLTKGVVQEARKVAMPEMCTNAFAKMYEMLESYQLVRTLHSNVFNSLHLCEAPGAFICATNHYIKSRHPQTSWDWIACTLNPYFEGNSRDAMIDDDAFISETMNHWYFGKDNSGDMRLRHNIVGAWEQAKCNLGPIMLVTADGSIDCSDRPSEQEKVVSQLLFCEVVAALGALHPGQSPNSLSQY